MVLTTLKAGARIDHHRTAGRATIQALSGRLRLHVQGEVYELHPGQLLALDREVAHDLEALEDSAFVLTLAWPTGERSA